MQAMIDCNHEWQLMNIVFETPYNPPVADACCTICHQTCQFIGEDIAAYFEQRADKSLRKLLNTLKEDACDDTEYPK